MPYHTETPVYLLSYRDLRDLGICYSNAHLLRLEADEKFPRRVRLSPNRIAWVKAEIVEWIDARAKERGQ